MDRRQDSRRESSSVLCRHAQQFIQQNYREWHLEWNSQQHVCGRLNKHRDQRRLFWNKKHSHHGVRIAIPMLLAATLLRGAASALAALQVSSRQDRPLNENDCWLPELG